MFNFDRFSMDDPIELVFIIAECIIGFINITSNTIVIIHIKYNPTSMPSNIFILNSAIANILLGLVAPILISFIFFRNDIDFDVCVYIHCMLTVVSNSSFIMLLCVIFERFIAIRYPDYYINNINTTNSKYFLCVVWTFCFASGFIPYFWHKGIENYTKCVFIGAVLTRRFRFYIKFLLVSGLPVMVMTTVNLYISSLMKRLGAQRSIILIDVRNFAKPKRKRDLLSNLILVVAALMLPFHVLDALGFFVSVETSSRIFGILDKFGLLIANCDTVINPWIYAKTRTSAEFGILTIEGCNRRDAVIILNNYRPQNDVILDANSRSSSGGEDSKSEHNEYVSTTDNQILAVAFLIRILELNFKYVIFELSTYAFKNLINQWSI